MQEINVKDTSLIMVDKNFNIYIKGVPIFRQEVILIENTDFFLLKIVVSHVSHHA